MAILFDWYENPKTKDKQGEELTLHPRIKLNGSTTTDELRRHIQEYCSLTETDVLAVLDALSHFVLLMAALGVCAQTQEQDSLRVMNSFLRR